MIDRDVELAFFSPHLDLGTSELLLLNLTVVFVIDSVVLLRCLAYHSGIYRDSSSLLGSEQFALLRHREGSSDCG
jgi:hypothetical protein